jgi:dihydroorotate dehydrogenase
MTYPAPAEIPGFYGFLFRSFFSRIDPERAHQLAMPVIRLAGWPLVGVILARTLRPHKGLATRVLDITFPTPFGLAAGFDKNATMTRGLANLGFGHVEVGTVTALPQNGNPRPRLFRLIADRGLINRMGFNNDGAATVAKRLRRVRRGVNVPVIGVNIGKSRVVDVTDAVGDYVTSTKILAPLADYLVVNVSSPNTPGLRGLQEIDLLEPLVRAVFDECGSVPLFVKIAPDVTDEQALRIAEMCERIGVAGIVATNTTVSRSGLLTNTARVEAMGDGGVSGPPLAQRSLEILRLLRARLPKPFALISVGGVETAAHVRERLDAGADLVQGYTGFVYMGPGWARLITRGLNDAV